MKSELLQLGLPEKLCDEILDLFDTHTRTVEAYSKPKGKNEFQKNMADITAHANMLNRRLEKLTTFEIQLLNRYASPGVFDIRVALTRLAISSREAKKAQVRFSRKPPFLRTLTADLWSLL